MKRTLLLAMTITLSVTGLNSCDQITETKTSLEETITTKDLLTDVEELQKAEDEIKSMPKYAGKDVHVFQNVKFYGGDYPRISIDVVDPTNGENVDNYEYANGSWSEAQPVQISGGGDMDANVTPLKDIKFTTVAKVYDNYVEKVKTLEGVTNPIPDFIYFRLWVPNQTRTWESGDIETDRASYNITYNMDGSVKKFEKN